MTPGGSVHGVGYQTALGTLTVTDMVFVCHQLRKENSPNATVLRGGWVKPVSCHVPTVKQLLTMFVTVILAMVGTGAVCSVRTAVTFVPMGLVTVDSMAGGGMRAKGRAVLDMEGTALGMESA